MINKIKQLYAMPTYRCNLSCRHCDIRRNEDNFNRKEFIDKINNFDGRIIIFGGEPTLYEDRLYDIIYYNKLYGKRKITSISTNLLKINDRLINIYKDLSIATSWNPFRFSDDQYNIWIDNIHRLNVLDINIVILITLTEDLVSSNVNKFINMIDNWKFNNIKSIKFEYFIGYHNNDYYEMVDKWLCELYNKWRSNIKVDIFEDEYHQFECSELYTLTPDGKIFNICPNGFSKEKYIPNECIICDKYSICRPCILQERCSYPHKLKKIIKEKEV